jgi:DHA1 family bicyclomycin/chloramphenicol resistance-like MFS transporter
MSAPSLARVALVLGSLTALGPLATDLYLPALPGVEAALSTDAAGVQATLIAYFAGFGLAQLIWGPLADRLGRRPVILGGASLFAAASVGCALVPDVATLIVLRGAQAVGAAALMVVPRAVVTDLYKGAAAAKLMGVVMIVTAASPLLAPLAGSGLLTLTDWRGLFWAIAAAAVLAFIATALLLPESLRVRRYVPPRALLAGAGATLVDPRFVRPALASAFGFAILIVAAPFVFADSYGLDPAGFALAFAAIALGIVLSAGMGGALTKRIGAPRTLDAGLAIYLGAALLALTWALLDTPPLWGAIAALFAVTAGLGLVVPISTVLALGPQDEKGGHVSRRTRTCSSDAPGAAGPRAVPV